MSREEYEGLKEGDHVWVFTIEFSDSNRGNVTLALIAELMLTNKLQERFNVLQVKLGTSLRVGGTTFLGRRFGWINLFKTYEEGKEDWNSQIRNFEDKVTSDYQIAIKNIRKRLL